MADTPRKPQSAGRREAPAPSGPTADGRIPPYNQEAEAAVLGAVLLDNKALAAVQEVLTADDFYVEANRRIYEAITSLSQSSLPIDHVTLGTELKRIGDLEKIGGPMALANLTNQVATTANVETYAKLVKEKAAVRRMIYAASQVVADGFGDYGTAEDFLDNAEKAVFEASKQRIRSPYEPISRIIQRTFEDLASAAKSHDGVTGAPTGIADFDRYTSGFQPSDLIILAARPSMGKTALALNFAVNVARTRKRPVLVFSLEMSKAQLVRRVLCSEGRIDATRMRDNRLNIDDWPILTQAAGELSHLPIYIDDTPALTPLEVRAKARRLSAEGELALIVVDYLQLMRAGGRRGDNREQEISEISRSLKALAKELNVPIIALSQLNRSLESRPDKRPQMSDLRESGAIEQDADLIVFIYRDDYYNKESEKKNIAEIIIAKQRSGPTGTVEARWSPAFTRFDSLARGDEQAGY